VVCPGCAKKAKRVSSVTLRALLKDQFAAEIGDGDHACCDSNSEGCIPISEDTGWRFCDSTDCNVVYFSEEGDTSFTKSQLKVPVGVKETTGERPLCYCFGHSVASIKDEVRMKGRSDALEDIRVKMKDPGCHCETSNPSGSCCLGSVTKGIQIALEELESKDSNQKLSAPATSSSHRGENIAKIGTVVSAIMASACCWLPLVLLAVGVSGAGIAASLEVYRPLFIVVTFGFLGAAFYFTYRPKKAAAAGHGCCSPDPAEAGNCCPPSGIRRFNMMALNKVMLWGVTVLAVAFLFFPSYVGVLFGTGDDAVGTENMNRAVFQIEGMTCEGCATTVAQAIRQVPGVMAVEVSYEKKQAVVGVAPDQPIPEQEIFTALKQAGYSGEVVRQETTVTDDDQAITPANTNEGAVLNREMVRETVVNIEGMTCEGCATAVAEALRSVPGVSSAHVDFRTGRATIQSPACCKFPAEDVLSSVRRAGFQAEVAPEE
jgi:copper chaperone CopZ